VDSAGLITAPHRAAVPRGVSSAPRLLDPIIGVSGILDRPPEPVIGRREAPTRWRATTAEGVAPPSLRATGSRECALAARSARGVDLSSAQGGRGERRMPNAPAASCALVEQKYFRKIRKKDSTAPSTNRPTGKSVDARTSDRLNFAEPSISKVVVEGHRFFASTILPRFNGFDAFVDRSNQAFGTPSMRSSCVRTIALSCEMVVRFGHLPKSGAVPPVPRAKLHQRVETATLSQHRRRNFRESAY
jgi:hypothetical protein